MAWLWESEKALNSTIITLYWKQWHQADEIMNSRVSNTDQAALKGPRVWAAQGRDWFDHEEALYLHSLEISLGKNILKVFQVLSPICLSLYRVNFWQSSPTNALGNPSCATEDWALWDYAHSFQRTGLKELGSYLHRVWLASVDRSGSGAGIL